MTLEMLIAWHQQRAGDCFSVIARATYVLESIAQELKSTAQFHIEAVQLLLTFGGGDLKRH